MFFQSKFEYLFLLDINHVNEKVEKNAKIGNRYIKNHT